MKVAFGKVNITPKDYIGKAMAGYTRTEPCLGKLDDIHAYGILLEEKNINNNCNRLLFISTDLLKIPLSLSEYIKDRIQKFISINPEQILIHATHTHSSFDLTGEFYWPGGALNVMKGIMFGANRNDKYLVWMTKKIVKMVSQLVKELIPCKIAWTKKQIDENIIINRRHPTRRSKSDLGVIAFRKLKDNNLIGIIVNFSCHPTTLSFLNNKLSADFPGRIVFKIQKLTKGRVNAVFFNSYAGDLNPITTCGTNFENLKNNITLIYDQLGTYKHTKSIGYFLGKQALNLAQSIPNEVYFENVELGSCIKKFWIPMKDFKYFSKTWLKNKLLFLLKKYLLIPVTIISGKNPNFSAFHIKYKGLKAKCNTIIQYFKIKASSDSKSKILGIMTAPGELFEEIGKNLLEKSPTGKDNSFIFPNSNDWISYLFPIKEYIEVGGYEPFPSFSPVSGVYIEKEMLKLFEEIKNKIL